MITLEYVQALLKAKTQGISASNTPTAFQALKRLEKDLQREFDGSVPFPEAQFAEHLRGRGVPGDEIAIVLNAKVRAAKPKTKAKSKNDDLEWWQRGGSRHMSTATVNHQDDLERARDNYMPVRDINSVFADYRCRGMDRQHAWTTYIKDTILLPQFRTDHDDSLASRFVGSGRPRRLEAEEKQATVNDIEILRSIGNRTWGERHQDVVADSTGCVLK